MKIGEKNSLELLNTNIKIFKEVPKELTSWEISKLEKLIHKKFKYDQTKLSDLLDDLFLGLLVDEHIGCWLVSNKSKYKYRVIKFNKVNTVVHRLTYSMFIHPILSKDNQICHHCDIPGCCNPWHLFQGTDKMNMRDARAKGRFNRNKGLTQAEKFLLHRHLNNTGNAIKVDPLDDEWYKKRIEREVTERAKDADKFFGKMK